MASEDPFVEIALAAANDVLSAPLLIKRGATLLYQITVDNLLRIRVNPKLPVRGQSAFQTDLCIREKKAEDVEIPRIVMEFKGGLSTLDVLTYSAKARKHKQIYPYLRYGVVLGDMSTVPGRFFVHNESLDFCVAAASYKSNRLHQLFAELLSAEVTASRELEAVAYNINPVHVFRNDIIVRKGDGKIA
jgi:hypothetical protein